MHIQSNIRDFVAAGLGMLIGVGAMTVAGIMAEGTTTTEAIGPRLLTVERLAAFCQDCRTADSCQSITHAAFCRGIFAGVADSRPEISRLCVPENWDTNNAITMFLAWAVKHPESKAMSASDGIVRAHAASFDCRKAGGDI